MFQIPTIVVDLFQIASAIAVAGAFIYAGLRYRSGQISEQITRSYECLKDLKDLQASKIEHSDAYLDSDAMDQWYERYFNSWEWFSFMVNEKQIKDRNIKRFFKRSLMTDYERIFEKHFTKERIDKDGEFYPEFRSYIKN